MTIEELKKKLDSITGNRPVDNARRLAIMDMIGRLMNGDSPEQ